MPRAARSFSPAAAIHEAIEPDPESRDHGLHLTQQKYVAARRTRRERARGVRPFGSCHFSREKMLTGQKSQKCEHFAPENDANQRVGRRALVLDEFVAQRHNFAE